MLKATKSVVRVAGLNNKKTPFSKTPKGVRFCNTQFIDELADQEIDVEA